MATQQLATLTDLSLLGVKPEAFTGLSDAQKTRALVSASSFAASYLKKRFAFPLVQWGDDLRRCVCTIASYYLMVSRGFNPASGNDNSIVISYRDMVGEPGKLGWLDRVALGECEPDDVIDSSPNEDEDAPLVSSEDSLDWMIPSDPTDSEA